MVRKLEYEEVNRNKALSFQKDKLGLFSQWNERQICKKRTGIEVANFDRFLEDFKKHNDLREDQVSILRDIKYAATIEDKVKSFQFSYNGGLAFGMIAATKVDGIIEFVISMFVVQYRLLGAPHNNVVETFEEDFIKMKALESFRQHGYIQSIKYI